MKTNDVEKQRHYDEKARLYEEKIKKLEKNEPAILEKCRRNSSGAALALWSLADEMLNLASNHLALNGICRSVFGIRDEEALNEARKDISKAIIYIENVVTGKIDVPFSEYSGNLAELAPVSAESKYLMVRKIGIAIELLKYGYGDNTKWRWTFIDIEGRYTAVAKNLLDLRKALSSNDPSSPDYEPIHYHLHLIKLLLEQQAHHFQERFSIATKRADDLRLALNFLGALRQMLVLTNLHNDAEEIKKKYDVWMAAYNIELEKQQKKSHTAQI